MQTILITGATGFVGRHLLRRIDLQKHEKIYCLSRTGEERFNVPAGQARIVLLRGGLLDLQRHEAELTATDAVVHLAAVTGKARPEEYFRVNLEGTRTLVEVCRKAGVKRFLYLSSIAARFPEKHLYYYAQSKEQAEEIVRKSGLRFAILRPTMILGPTSPVWANLSRLAQLPIIPIFGDGKTRIQPIDVDDLADFILAVLEGDLFDGETFELGGPDVLTIEEFLTNIRRLRPGASRAVHLPLAAVIPLLSALERLFYPLLPVTVGQLSSFRCDSTITPNRLFAERRAQLKTTDELLAKLCSGEARERARLRQESHIFCRYLVGSESSEYVSGKYADAHGKVVAYAARGRFDRFLVWFAASRPLFTKLADSYARMFAPTSALRNKLILLAAILESTAPSHRSFEAVESKSIPVFFLEASLKGLLFLLSLLAASLLLAPVHLLLGRPGEQPTEAR